VVGTHQIEMWPKEVQNLRRSGLVLRQTLEQVLSRIGRKRK
jgi:L-lactate dehydrogenase